MPVLRHAGCPESELALIGFLIAAQAQPPQKQAQSPSRSSVDLCSRQRKECRNPKMARSIRLLVVYAEELEWRTIPRAFQSGGEIPLREEPGRRSAKPSWESRRDYVLVCFPVSS